MMHKCLNRVLLSLVLLLASQWAMAGGAEKPAEIRGDVAAAGQAWDLIGDGALLIDVRSAEEFNGGSIEGAINIPHTQIDAIADLIGTDLDRPVVVFCRSGGRSGRAQAALEQRGYTEVFNGTGYTALLATQPD